MKDLKIQSTVVDGTFPSRSDQIRSPDDLSGILHKNMKDLEGLWIEWDRLVFLKQDPLIGI